MTSEDESNELLGDIKFEDTSSITVPENLIDQVIGQDEAVEVIKKAASQRRHVMLIGSPGTGKSMLGKAMSELLPVEDLQDVLVYANPEDNNTPRVRVVPAGRGKQIVDAQKPNDIQMLFSLRHDPFTGIDDQDDQIHASDTGKHLADKFFMTGNVHKAYFCAVCQGKRRKA